MEQSTWNVIVNLAQALAAFAAATSAVMAWRTLRASSSERSNAHMLKHAVTSLERAYQSLVGDSAPGTEPPHDRVAWLTAARLIEEYKSAKSRITDDLTLQECESHEEHWRHQIYLRLAALQEEPSSSYFSPRRRGEEIQPVSAIIVHHFAMWPDEKADPLAKFNSVNEAYDQMGIHMKWRKLRVYCGRP